MVENLFNSFNVKKSDQFVPGKIRKVFIADDDIFSNALLRNMIESDTKYQVFSFFNGLELCNYYEEREKDVSAIILDIEMPERNGIEAAQWIRNYECSIQAPRMPIIGLTGHDNDIINNRCFNAGMDAVLCKPINKAVVINTLNQLIE